MKRMLGALVVVATVLAASAGMAKTLEDVLKEKGVISEADYKEVTKSKPLNYKLGQGFTLTSPDEKFSTTITSLLQIRYSFTDMDDANDSATKHSEDVSRFELRRVKLLLGGYAYSKDLTYRFVVNFANSQNPTNTYGLLEYTFMDYRFLDELQIRAGQDKVPFGRQFITPSAMQQFVDRSMPTVAFIPGMDTGVMLHGKFADGLVNYNIGGYGGVGQNTFRKTSDNAFVARLTVNPLGDMKYGEADMENSQKPLVSLGANFFRDTLKGTEANNLSFTSSKGWYGIGKPLQTVAAKQISASESVDFNSAGIDAAFKWRGFSAQGEYFVGYAKGQTSENMVRAEGFYAQAGYFVIPGTLEIAARYSYLDPNRDVLNDHWVESTGAVSWYINKHYLKLQTDYTNIHRQPAVASTSGNNPTDDQQIRFNAQILF